MLLLVLGACGGSPTATAPSATTSTTLAATTTAAPTTTAPALPPVAQDAVAARRVLLRAGDLPGFAQSSSPEPTDFATVYFTCTRDVLLPGGRSPRSASQGDFLLDETATVRAVQTTLVSSFASLADSESDARRAVVELAKPEVAQCAGKALAAAVNGLTSPPGTAPANPPTVALPSLDLGDESAGLRTTVTRAAVPQYFDLTVVRRGRALAFLFVSRLSKAPFPEADRRRIVGVLAARLP